MYIVYYAHMFLLTLVILFIKGEATIRRFGQTKRYCEKKSYRKMEKGKDTLIPSLRLNIFEAV